MSLEPRQEPELPVPWEKLKAVADAHAPPRLRLEHIVGLMVGLLMIGLSVLAFLIGIVLALDPGETVEPSTGLVIALVGLGFTAALVAVVLLLKPGSSRKT